MRAALSTQGAGSIRHTISWNAPPISADGILKYLTPKYYLL